jgi:hypothetical protein
MFKIQNAYDFHVHFLFLICSFNSAYNSHIYFLYEILYFSHVVLIVHVILTNIFYTKKSSVFWIHIGLVDINFSQTEF